MIAACLLTCGRDRDRETIETATSFSALNYGRRDLVLLHCDGGPYSKENVAIAAAAGFSTIWQPAERVGQIESFRRFMSFVLFDPSIEFLLWLENDWASDRPIPSIDFLRRFPEVDQFRMYGARKMRGDGPRAPAGVNIIGTKTPIDWKPLGEFSWDIARAHWGAGGTIVRPLALAPFVDRPRLKDVIVGANNLLTMRPRENYLWHIGETTTGGFFG